LFQSGIPGFEGGGHDGNGSGGAPCMKFKGQGETRIFSLSYGRRAINVHRRLTALGGMGRHANARSISERHLREFRDSSK
jgi:hypothetical protein